MKIESAARPKAFQRPRRQAEQAPSAVLERCGGIIPDKSIQANGGISALSFREAVTSGIRWGGLLNTAPSALALMNDGLIGFSANPETRESLSGGHGASTVAYSLLDCSRLKTGCDLFAKKSGNSERDFWTGQTCVSESKSPTKFPALWSCSRKMISPRLRSVKRKEGRGIRQRSLRVTAIAALTKEVVQENEKATAPNRDSRKLSRGRGSGRGGNLF